MQNSTCNVVNGNFVGGSTSDGWTYYPSQTYTPANVFWWPNYYWPPYDASLADRVMRAEMENAVLRGKIETLEKMVAAMLNGRLLVSRKAK